MDDIDKYLKSRIDKYIHLIPAHMHDGLLNYVLHHIEPGGFLCAVLSNDLKGAAGRADHINQKHLYEWVEFCRAALPSACWGSEDKVLAWLSKGKNANQI